MKDRPVILCVDDEESVLEGIALTLRTKFVIQPFTNPLEALQWLKENPNTNVVLSDMRMPLMNGADFLAAAVDIAPKSSRILLTGQADVESAMKAVNQGKLFKFLTKPCPPQILTDTVVDAFEQSAKSISEEKLLERTVNGCVHALVEVLVLTNPGALGRSMQMRSLAGQIARTMNGTSVWKIEMAALFCNLGRALMPPNILKKVTEKQELTTAEKKLVAESPIAAQRILLRIPKLEDIAEILQLIEKPYDPVADRATDRDSLTFCANILKVAKAYEDMREAGASDVKALLKLEQNGLVYSQRVLTVLREVVEKNNAGKSISSVKINQLREGMTLAEDLMTSNDTLLLSEGHVLTATGVDRLVRLPPGCLKEPVLVFVEKKAA
ncbi:response regulator [Kamptonema cortianum]|nr:response regulator [Geitlerinema splendidum]MDK3155851.1 response regulator [Kamptonema cortianum]